MALHVLHSGLWALEFRDGSLVVGPSGGAKRKDAHGGKLARSFPDPSAAPNELPSNVYDFLERARAINIDQEELQALHSGLPQFDDDEFMTELAALPDQDEAEEARVAGRDLVTDTRLSDQGYRVQLPLLRAF